MTARALMVVGRTALLALGLLLPSPREVVGQEGDGPPNPAPETKHMVATRLDGSVTLDGRLDEGVWRQASFSSDFHQKGKDQGFDPRVRTRVAFLYDDDALYVGAYMERDSAGGSMAALGGRDDGGNADRILISLDTFRDLRTAYTFGVTESGVRIDYVSSRDNESWTDDSYDPVWQARVSVDSTGWSAEMRIPFSQLRFSGGSNQVWGINVRRWHPATYLNVYWVVIPYYETGWTSRFGELSGLKDIDGGAGVEVTPYVLGRATYDGSPVGSGSPDETLTRYGGDVKAGLGPNLTLDATFRPDFGQVEADPARVNLSAFETFFPERRPFFTEGSELFRVQGPNYFYSRRVGSIPAGALPRDLFEQVESATFLGGAKVTGRDPSGLSVGALAALTDQEKVDVAVDSTGATVAVPAAPRTVFGVGRVQQEFGSAGSNIGVMATGVERMFGSQTTLSDVLTRRAVAGGVDWTLRFGGGAYELTGYGGGSYVSGQASAIQRLQESSAHYFQRPDADHVSLDPDATSMQGWAAGMTLGKIGGAHWMWSASTEASSPGFEIRDAGSQRRADRVDAQASLTYRTRDGRGDVRDRGFGISAATGWNFGGIRRHTSLGASGAVTWGNLWTTTVDGGVNLRALSDDLTRGGPLMETPLAGWVNLGLYSSKAADASWNVQGTSYFDELGGWSGSMDGGVRIQASARLELGLQAGVTVADDARQFVAVADGGPADTYGQRYIFSALKRKEIFTQARAKIAFAPDVVLTLYAEPFLSSGRFHDFGELTAARARTLRSYGTDNTVINRLSDGSWVVLDGSEIFSIPNYDFWVRSFRSTSVFRWEWRRGSTLFLIWQRSLSSFDDAVGPDGARAFFGAFKDPGKNTFVAKVSVLFDVG